MLSKSFQVTDATQISGHLEEVIVSGFDPTLAIVFGSISCDLSSIPGIFDHFNIDMLGASTAGEFCNGQVFEKGITVLLLNMDRSCFEIHTIEAKHKQNKEAGVRIGHFGKLCFDNPAFLVFGNLNLLVESVIAGISEEVKKPVIFGGIAGDDLRMVKTFTFSNEGVFENRLVSLVLDNDKIEMKGTALCGWESFGTLNTITKAENNIIYTINDKPALEAFQNYFGCFQNELIDAGILAINIAQYPLQIVKGNKAVLRAAINVNKNDNSIVLAGPVETGDQFKFSIAPGFEIIDQTVGDFKNYQANHEVADALILISCKARHMALGPMIEEEVKGIQRLWNKPMIGFFSYGEIGLDEEGSCHFYNETCSLVLLKET